MDFVRSHLVLQVPFCDEKSVQLVRGASFFCMFFRRIEGKKNCFWDFLTFKKHQCPQSVTSKLFFLRFSWFFLPNCTCVDLPEIEYNIFARWHSKEETFRADLLQILIMEFSISVFDCKFHTSSILLLLLLLCDSKNYKKKFLKIMNLILVKKFGKVVADFETKIKIP